VETDRDAEDFLENRTEYVYTIPIVANRVGRPRARWNGRKGYGVDANSIADPPESMGTVNTAARKVCYVFVIGRVTGSAVTQPG